MGKINWARVLLGGLLAGAVAHVLTFAAWYLFLQGDWIAALEALGRPTQSGVVVLWIVLVFVAGIFAVWLYAAIRPRYGPGPKTAACAGFAVWFFASLLPMIWLGLGLGLFPGRLVAIHVGTFLVITVVATLVGAWPYQE